ncbi:hypothetical protein LZY01_07000 [Levilactobacillus zymae]|uniref:Uncharacterized protein n=1 Tax=Levilactobacillus zymae TaxID=267363 RepID=A0ABQ0WYY5_9LACO|nr:hypothetical protein [Levilactobacillus zymae]KRL11137.1 hypothetical protein FD38_GL001646 [Levilactobacillus zymae DSM 19395]QFR60033.1 hypothetical protein LZ395_00105 [Levilactobacillus zymae]QFR62388.1 hypothetical protein LZ395_12915 [Levilactobacillus zymae]GEO71532.1 hypothetical protein LZY01_07000 [Levilactobacillus zymae]
MTDNQAWLHQQLQALAQHQAKFTDRAFWVALDHLAAEQARRQDQLQGEIDGRTWRPDKW